MFKARSVCPASLDSVFLRKQKFLRVWWRRVLGLASAGGGSPFKESTIPSEPDCPCEHWILPTGFYDPPCVYPDDYPNCTLTCSAGDPCYGTGAGYGNDHFSNPLNSFDDDLATYAEAYLPGVSAPYQQCRIYYTLVESVLTDKVRVYSHGYGFGDYTKIEVKSEGVWVQVGDFYNAAGNHWFCPTFSEREITEVKIWNDAPVYSCDTKIFNVNVCKLG